MKYIYARATPDGKCWGLINNTGEYIVAPEFATIHQWKEGTLRLTKKQSEVIAQDGIWINRYNGAVYFVDYKGAFINTNPYAYGLDFSEGLAAVVLDGKWGFISNDGHTAIEFMFQKTYGFKEGLSATQRNDKWGFINKQGKWVIEPVYEKVQSYAFGLAVVKRDEAYFIINKSDEVITQIPDGYPWAVIKSKNIVLYGTTSEDIGARYYGFMHVDGSILSEPVYYVESEYQFDLFHYADGMLIVSNEEDQYGYLNAQGQLAIPCLYDAAESFVDGLAVVTLNDQKYAIDKNGVLTKFAKPEHPFDEVLAFHDGLAAVRKGDKWGFVDQKWVVAIDFIFNEYPPHKVGLPSGVYLAEIFPKFSCGLLPIIKSDGEQHSSGFVDKTGKEVIPCTFLFVQKFEEVWPL